SELGLIPEGWRVGKLGEITSITSGKNLPKKDLATKGKYEVLGANGKIGETNKYLFDKQLIFTGRVGTLGNVFLSNEPAWYSDNTLLIFPKNNFLYYVYRYLQRQRLEKLDRGSTQPLITQTDLKTILLPIPSLSLLNKFEKISTLINNKITQNKNNIDYFQKIKTALLNKLILA
ncbi:MAG: restriction endonuclease subunit S, partial [Caldisericia bacterium]|nr:restriction endonuclease subunit S [Caldisericia bacterium]